MKEESLQLGRLGQGSRHVEEAVVASSHLAHGPQSDEVAVCCHRHWSQPHHRQNAPRRSWSPTVRPLLSSVDDMGVLVVKVEAVIEEGFSKDAAWKLASSLLVQSVSER